MHFVFHYGDCGYFYCCSSCGELQPRLEFHCIGFNVDLGNSPESPSLSVQNLI